MKFLYSLFYTAVFLLTLPYYFFAGLFTGKYFAGLRQRFGSIKPSSSDSCWIHAVSVGEFLAAKPLIQRLRSELPHLPLFVSTTTLTAQKLAQAEMPGAAFYFPFDWRWSVRRVFRRIRPQLIVILETEIWPNFLWEAEAQNIPVLLINGRLSDRSFPRYLKFRSWLPKFAECLMQSKEDEIRMQALGISRGAITTTGNLKFDFHPPSLPNTFRSLILEWKGSDLLWIAGSTMRGEEDIVLDVFARLRNRFPLKLLIAPRHPERFESIGRLLSDRQIPFIKRTAGRVDDPAVMLLDSLGELAGSYEFADFVFMGGSLHPPGGGHNPIEPAYFGKAIITGPHIRNFRSIFEDLEQHEAVLISNDVETAATNLLEDVDKRNAMGLAAKAMVGQNLGATDLAIERVRSYVNGGRVVDPRAELSLR